MMKVLYYYYYLFYTKVIPDNQPHATVIFVLGLLLSLIVKGFINIILAFFFGIVLTTIQMCGISLILMWLVYSTLYKNGKGERIVTEEKPKFFNSHKWSIILALSLFFISILFLFDAFITRAILENPK